MAARVSRREAEAIGVLGEFPPQGKAENEGPVEARRSGQQAEVGRLERVGQRSLRILRSEGIREPGQLRAGAPDLATCSADVGTAMVSA